MAGFTVALSITRLLRSLSWAAFMALQKAPAGVKSLMLKFVMLLLLWPVMAAHPPLFDGDQGRQRL